MKNLRLAIIVVALFAVLPTNTFAQTSPENSRTARQDFRFTDAPGLHESAKDFFDSMIVWFKTPRSPTTFREAYASALSFKLALVSQAAKESNPAFRSQIKELVPMVTLVVGHLEEYIGNDLASKKLAEVGLNVSANALKRDEIVKSAVAAAFSTFAGFAIQADSSPIVKAFTDLCWHWGNYGGPTAPEGLTDRFGNPAPLPFTPKGHLWSDEPTP